MPSLVADDEDEAKPFNQFLPKLKGKNEEQTVVMYLGTSKAAFHGWENLNIAKKLDTLATGFKFRIPQKFREKNKEFKLSPNVKVKISVNDHPTITGRIEHIVSVFSVEENYLEVS